MLYWLNFPECDFFLEGMDKYLWLTLAVFMIVAHRYVETRKRTSVGI